MIDYGVDVVAKYLKPFGVPDFIIKRLYEKLFPIFVRGLEWNWNVALPYIPQRYIDEFHGIADGSNGLVNYDYLRLVNMLPELT
jgi:hypothetical protein